MIDKGDVMAVYLPAVIIINRDETVQADQGNIVVPRRAYQPGPHWWVRIPCIRYLAAYHAELLFIYGSPLSRPGPEPSSRLRNSRWAQGS